MFSSNSGRFDTLLYFLRGTGACFPGKKKWKIEVFQTAGKALRLSILTPPIYFCYLCSFKSFTVPLGGRLFCSNFFFFFWGGGNACGPGST